MKISLITCLAGLILLGLTVEAVQQFYPYKTLVVNSATVKTESIKAGDILTYTVDYCKYTDKPAVVYRTFHSVDESVIIPFPAVSTISIEGCHVANIPLQTFSTIPPGEYYLLVDANFQVNTKREIDVIFKTNSFQIK